MSPMIRIIIALGIASVVVGGISGAKAFAQADPNSAPNPYRTVENWAKLPDGWYLFHDDAEGPRSPWSEATLIEAVRRLTSHQ